MTPAGATTHQVFTLSSDAGANVAHVTAPGSWGYLTQVTVRFTDGSTHTDNGSLRGNHIRDMRLWECTTGQPCANAPGPDGDRIVIEDFDDPGNLTQAPVPPSHYTGQPLGSGSFLTISHYEHGGVKEVDFWYGGGQVLQTVYSKAPYLAAINIARPWNGPMALEVDYTDAEFYS